MGSNKGFNAISGVATLTIAFSGENGKSVRSFTIRMMSWSGNHAKVRLSMTSDVSSSEQVPLIPIFQRITLSHSVVNCLTSLLACLLRNRRHLTVAICRRCRSQWKRVLHDILNLPYLIGIALPVKSGMVGSLKSRTLA